MREVRPVVDLYDAAYGNFGADVYAEIRRETFGVDIGQNSWLTLDELDGFISRLALGPSSRVLDVGCGSGGPALHVSQATGCRIVGVDLHEEGVATANRMARGSGLEAQAQFIQADASAPLPFDDGSFDAIFCIDAVNHLPDRPRVFADWARLLAAGGRLLFTDPITVTGPISSDEISIRASIGYFLFVPVGEDERMLAEAGFHVLHVQDATQNMAELAARRAAARARRSDALRRIEGDETFDGQQRFFEVAAALGRERRLSRFTYLAERTV